MSGETSSGPTGSPRGFRQRLVPYVTAVAHGSAPFISTFLAIHLSAPLFANLGGTSLASQIMILGREYYQTPFGEAYLVLLPLAIHPISAITKRLLLTSSSSSSSSHTPSPRSRSLTSLLSLTAYPLLLFLLPIHFLTHRLNPADPSPPIHAVGPSELDYEYVKLALHEWPIRSWLLYGGLTACVVLHAAEGMRVIWTKWVYGKLGGRLWKKGSTKMAALAVVPVLSGVFWMSREPLMTFASTAARFRAALSRSIFYRL